jgi:hypothetical protein
MTSKKFYAMVLTLFLMLTSILCGCGKHEAKLLEDSGATNNITYADCSFWHQPNQLRLVINYNANVVDNGEPQYTDTTGEIKVPTSAKSKILDLKSGIIAFFKEHYNIDVSEKLAKQKVRFFETLSARDGSMVMGYVDVSNRNILNLNGLLLTEYSNLLETTFVHETIHQLGVSNSHDGLLMEGVTDAFADLILCSMGRTAELTPYYYDARILAYQIIKVDKELVHLYFEGDKSVSLSKRISERLSTVPQELEPTKNPGAKLVDMVSVLNSYAHGNVASSNDPLYYQYDAQDIVRAYIQTFDPSDEEIDYVRKHYLLYPYEELKFKEREDGGGYEQIF